MDKFDGKTEYLHISKGASMWYFLIRKEKNSNFTLEKPGGQHLNQVIKADDASNGTNQYHVKNTTVIFLTKNV